jgi:uncharacterized membrane protein HdeD (DUF308 family)
VSDLPAPRGARSGRVVVGVVLAVYLLMNMPVSAEWVLGALLGIQLLADLVQALGNACKS